jgi:2-polyprenyl-6-hydroxyphenyl methylase/3-demethylubiquinone-9 3-methyltransferase
VVKTAVNLHGIGMWLKQKIKNVVRGLRQQWASPDAKKALWDQEYAVGRWNHCEHTPDALIYEYVYRYCRNGSVLDLGCGSGNTGNEMDTGRYGDYTGVDVSEVAVKKAAARSAGSIREKKNRYLQADILDYEPSRTHDIILFRESIYYVPLLKIKAMLQRYSNHLTEQGAFVVHVGGTRPEKGQKILDIIERSFMVLEKESPNNSGDFVVVFRTKP